MERILTEKINNITKILEQNFSNSLRNGFLREFPVFEKTLVRSLYFDNQLISLALFRSLHQNLVEIDFIATQAEFLRKGLATKIVNSFSSSEVWLEVHEKNSSALHFYIKNNFKEVGRRPHYYHEDSAILLSRGVNA